MFSKDEYVVYATNGVCLIEDIAPMRNSEDDRLYYILRPVSNGASVLYVPMDNSVLCEKMRYVFDETGLQNILDEVKAQSLEWVDDRKNRMNLFRQMLHGGNLKELILLADCIYKRGEYLEKAGKRLSDADDTVFRNAIRIVNDEFSWSLGIPKTSVNGYIMNYMLG